MDGESNKQVDGDGNRDWERGKCLSLHLCLSLSLSLALVSRARSQGGAFGEATAGPNDSGHSENTLIIVEALRTRFRNVSIVPVAALAVSSLSVSRFSRRCSPECARY